MLIRRANTKNNNPLCYRSYDMFTDRVTSLEPEGAYAVLARAQALEAQGRDIIHLELGQPDFPTPDNVREVGVHAIYAWHTR